MGKERILLAHHERDGGLGVVVASQLQIADHRGQHVGLFGVSSGSVELDVGKVDVEVVECGLVVEEGADTRRGKAVFLRNCFLKGEKTIQKQYYCVLCSSRAKIALTITKKRNKTTQFDGIKSKVLG